MTYQEYVSKVLAAFNLAKQAAQHFNADIVIDNKVVTDLTKDQIARYYEEETTDHFEGSEYWDDDCGWRIIPASDVVHSKGSYVPLLRHIEIRMSKTRNYVIFIDSNKSSIELNSYERRNSMEITPSTTLEEVEQFIQGQENLYLEKQQKLILDKQQAEKKRQLGKQTYPTLSESAQLFLIDNPHYLEQISQFEKEFPTDEDLIDFLDIDEPHITVEGEFDETVDLERFTDYKIDSKYYFVKDQILYIQLEISASAGGTGYADWVSPTYLEPGYYSREYDVDREIGTSFAFAIPSNPSDYDMYDRPELEWDVY